MDKQTKLLNLRTGKAAFTVTLLLLSTNSPTLAQTPLWNSQVSSSGEASVPGGTPPAQTPDLATWRIQAESQIAAISNHVMCVYIDWPAGWTSIDLGENEFDLVPKLGWSYSTDGGQTYTDMGALYTGTPNDGPDPTLVADLVNKQFVLSTLSVLTVAQGAPVGYGGKHGLYVFSSNYSWNGTEGAVNPPTWSGPFRPLYKLDNRELTIDKPWMAVDNFPGSGQGNQYVAFNLEATGAELDAAQNSYGVNLQPGIYLLRKPAGGSWTPTSLSATPTSTYPQAAMTDLVSVRVQTRPGDPTDEDTGHASGVQVVVAPDHNVYVFWLEGLYTGTTYQRIMFRKYSPNGTALTSPAMVASLSSGSHSSLNALGLEGLQRSDSYPRAAVNPSSGELYVVYADNPAGTDRADIYPVSSTNGGSTWTQTPIRVNDDPTTRDQFQPVIAIKPNGYQMFIGWYSRQNDADNYDVDIYGRKLVYQYGSGWTWLPSFRITPESFDGGSATTTVRLHDYDGAFADSTSFYLSWTDRYDAVDRESDIYATRIPANPTQYYVFDLASSLPSTWWAGGYGINNLSSPQVAGWYQEEVSPGLFQLRAFRGQPYSITTLVPAYRAIGFDINDSLTAVGWLEDAGGWDYGWRVMANGTTQILGSLSTTYPISGASGINNAGVTVGYSYNNSYQSRPVVWASGSTTPSDMGSLNGSLTGPGQAIDISHVGRVTGSADLNGVPSAFRTQWDFPLIIQPPYGGANNDYLGSLGANTSGEGRSINAEGWVAGWSKLDNGQYRAFLCPDARPIQSTDDLGTLGGTYSVALGLNNLLTVVGKSTTSSYATKAFIQFRGGAMANLNSLLDPVYGGGWDLTAGHDINDYGVITGEGKYNGVPRAFIAYPMN